MRVKHNFTFFFSFLFLLNFGQKKHESIKKEEKLEMQNLQKKEKNDTLKFSKYKPNFLVGFDVLNAGVSAFSKRKIFQGFISSEIQKDLHAILEAGFEKNVYQKIGYNATANGIFMKIGAIYMLAKDSENSFNGFYGGGKLAGSFYNQEYFAIPVRGYQGGDISVAFPASSQSSYWLEGSIGGRVQLFDSPFYIDVNMQPRYLVATTKQNQITPMIVAGFGRSSTKFNMGFSWNIAYKF